MEVHAADEEVGSPMPEYEQGPEKEDKVGGPSNRIETTSLRTLGEGKEAEEAKREIALAALSHMDARTQREVVGQLQLLPEQDRKAIAISLMPTQPVTDWIWKVTVGVFASVFVIATLALCASALWSQGDVQTLLTVVTTVAGILAGFISGRASTGGTAS
jgi:hypothetical protein